MEKLNKFYFILPSMLILLAVIGYFNNWFTDFVAISAIVVGVSMVTLAFIDKNKT